jgi:S-adenosyl methyltransferase
VAGDTHAQPLGINPSVATAARMYDYWLGGHENFVADRIAALQVAEAAPEVPVLARENRKFLGRVVRFLAGEEGVGQFLDLGTGLPTRGNVHQVAQEINSAARVVYVDNDPMVLAHSRALKTGAGTAVIEADMRDPEAILAHPDTRRLIDFGRPLAVLFVAALHFIADVDRPHALVSRFLAAAAPGSYLVISHATIDPSPQEAAGVTAVYAATSNPATPRSHDQILAFFDGLELIRPGVIPVQQWRPAGPQPSDVGKSWILGGVGRKLR